MFYAYLQRLDRDVDLISPMVTPLTYEGLVDDTLSIENSKIKVEASLLGADEPEPSLTLNASNKLEAKPAESKAERRLNPDEKVTVLLNSSDSIYAEIRNLSIERIGSYMQEKAIHIRERYAAFKENKDASLAEIHAFVKKIPKLTKDFKSLNQHIHIAELLKTRTMSRDFRALWQGERGMLEGESFLDELEDIVLSDCVEKKQLFRVLRMLCLQSVTSGGLKASKYDALRRVLVQTYGIGLLPVFQHLERSGLVRRKETLMVVDSTSAWQFLRKQLRLIDEKVNMSRPEDISFVAAGKNSSTIGAFILAYCCVLVCRLRSALCAHCANAYAIESAPRSSRGDARTNSRRILGDHPTRTQGRGIERYSRSQHCRE